MALIKTKEYLSIIEFLNSYETIKYKIKDYLNHQDDNRDNFLDIIKLNNQNSYDLYSDDSFIFLKNELKFNFIKIYKYLSEIHYINNNGKIFLNNNKLEDYQLLSSSIDIEPLISTHILDYTSHLDDYNRYRFIDKNIEIDFKFDGDIEKRIKEYSDLHIHLGASISFNIRLHYMLKNIHHINLNQDHQDLFYNLSTSKLNIKDIVFSISIIENILIELYELEHKFNKIDFKEIEFYYQNKDEKRLRIVYKDNQDYIKYIKHYIEIKLDLYNLLKLLENKDNIYIYIYYKKYTINSIRNINHLKEFYTFKNNFDDILLKNSFENFLKEDIKKADRYLIMFFITKINNKNKYSVIINIYFILRSIVKNFLIQQHKREGLGYFSLYSRNNIRRDKKEYERDIIISSLVNKNVGNNIEGRITLSDKPHEIIDNISLYINKFQKYKKNKDKLKFIFHFQKEQNSSKFEKDINKREPKWYKLRNRIKYQAFALNKVLTDPSYRRYGVYSKSIDDIKNINKISSKKFREMINNPIRYKDYVKKYIAGIDVAGRESLTPPEVFAPIYRYFKYNIETSGMLLKRDYPYIEYDSLKEIDFKYTYHVGEDSRDILSGLRAIFETILFLDLKKNDRLGHALILGIKPNIFLNNRNREIKLNNLEVLDNAIFTYYMINRFSKYFINFIEIKSNLIELIHGLSKYIYQNIIFNFDIDDLIDAWFLRRNCPNEILQTMSLFDSSKILNIKNKNIIFSLKEYLYDRDIVYSIPNYNYVKYAMPDFIKYDTNNQSSLHERYRYIKNNPIAYKLFWLYQQDIDVIKRSNEIYNKNFIFKDSFYETMQDVIMEHIIAKEEIIIESNLTSNILTGGLKSYSQHPIFRFKSIGDITPNKFNIRTKKLKVVLGTDNPGIQNTSFIKELYHLKNACNKNGFSDDEAYEYINDIIEEGNRAF